MKGHCDSIFYRTSRGSDVQRDGFFIELHQTTDGQEKFIAEAFWWDADNRFTIEFVEPGLPAGVLEAFLAEARQFIKPKSIGQESNAFVPDTE